MSKQQLNKWEDAVSKISARNLKGVDEELKKTYAKALRNIKAEIKAAIEDYDGMSFSQRMETDRLIETARQVQAQFNDAMQEASSSIHQHKAKMVEIGYYGEWYSSEAANKIEVDLPVLNKDFVEELVYNKVNAQRLSSRLYKNTRKVADVATDEIVQGIIKGEGYRQIGARIEEKTEATYYQATRIARTEGAQSQSSAKQHEYEQEKELGIEATKSWLATLDQRTRHTHAFMDGQTVGIEEEFTLPGGAKTIAPGLSGIAKEDIHCRCTMRKNTDGIPAEFRRDNETGEIISNMSYEEWAKMKGYPLPSEQIGQRKARDLELRDKQAEKLQEAVDEIAAREYRKVSTPKQLREALEDSEKIRKTLGVNQSKSLRSYAGNGFADINTLLRTPEAFDEFPDYFKPKELVEKDIQNVLNAINKSTIQADLKTYRYLDFADDISLDPENGITQFVENGFLSTSPLPKRSKFIKGSAKAEGGILLEIDIPKGTKGIYVDDMYGWDKEHELLLKPGTRLEYVDEKEYDDDLWGKRVIHLRMIPDE